ncbi:SEC14-like protein 4, partial [Harpegnathos saltator]
FIAAPTVFAFAFSIAKRFMNEYTLSKIEIYKADPRKWQAAIFKIVPKNQLPAHFGGTLTDSDGNPRFTSKVMF